MCPNRHTVAHAAAALVLLRELRAVLNRVSAADAALAAALAIPDSVVTDATDAVNAAVARNTRVVRSDAFQCPSGAEACVCKSCCPSYSGPVARSTRRGSLTRRAGCVRRNAGSRLQMQ